MRSMTGKTIEAARITSGPMASRKSYGFNGAFRIATGTTTLHIIASDGKGWDHVSVSIVKERRCPTWDEMCFVKGMFFEDEEAVMQLHPPRSDYVNCHPGCLHLWRPQTAAIPLPPSWMVGVKRLDTLAVDVEVAHG